MTKFIKKLNKESFAELGVKALTGGIDKNTPIGELKTERDVFIYIESKYSRKGIDFDYTSLDEYKSLVGNL